MNKGFQALGTMLNEAADADHVTMFGTQTGDKKECETVTKADQLMQWIGGAIGIAVLGFNVLGGVEGIQEKFNTDTGANIQRIELRQIKSV